MGLAVRELALSCGHEITAAFNSRTPLDTDGPVDALRSADVAIDFSLPSVAAAHVHAYCRWRQPAVVGTTGWAMHDLESLVAAHGSALLCSSNFSLGIQLVLQAIRGLGPLLDALSEYDVAIRETHHTAKVDRPSGTALQLAAALVSALARKTHASAAQGVPAQGGLTGCASASSTPEGNALDIASLRVGSVYGEHAVIIDSLFDQISITHTAKSRKGFALGALKAAEWLPGRSGLFTLDDVLPQLGQNPRIKTCTQAPNAQ